MSFGQEIKDFIGAFQATNKIFQDDARLDLERQRLLMQTNYWAAKQQALGGKGTGETTTDPATAAGDAARQRYYGGSGGGGVKDADLSQYSDLFKNVEQKYGLPAGYMTRLATVESSGNPSAYNKGSKAAGMFQFIPDTARLYGLSDPYNVAAAADAAGRLAADNAKYLRAGLGRDPNAGELYLAHQQGAEGAKQLLLDPNRAATAATSHRNLASNGYTNGMTAGQFASKWTSKFDNLGNYGSTVTADATPPDTTAPTPAVPTKRMGLGEVKDGLRKNGILKDGVQPAVPTTVPATVAATAPAVPASWGEDQPSGNKDPTGQDIPPGYHWENGTILADATPDEQEGQN